MVGRIYHVGLTVSDLDRSIAFYSDILGLEFQGEIFMEGEETDKMFRKENCKATKYVYSRSLSAGGTCLATTEMERRQLC